MNRQEAIKILDKERKEYIIKGCKLDKAIDMAIESLQEDWIPVSERLPEWWETEDGYVDSKPVLVCYGNADDCYHNMAVAEYVGRWEVMDDYAPLGDPIAWQPLPEPYKDGEEE